MLDGTRWHERRMQKRNEGSHANLLKRALFFLRFARIVLERHG